MGIRYLDEEAGTGASASVTPTASRIRYLDESEGEPRSVLNPFGLARFQDRPLTSKLLPPFSPLQLAFTPQAERLGNRMVEGARAPSDGFQAISLNHSSVALNRL